MLVPTLIQEKNTVPDFLVSDCQRLQHWAFTIPYNAKQQFQETNHQITGISDRQVASPIFLPQVT